MDTRKIFVFLSSLFLLLQAPAQSLERDYCYRGFNLVDDDCIFSWYDSNELCLSCFCNASSPVLLNSYKKKINLDSIPQLNESQKYSNNSCSFCSYRSESPIYSGYIHFRYKGDHPFLKRQIEYTDKYSRYQAYWPETSHRAEKISDVAIVLFEDLIDSTALKKVKQQRKLYENFITDSWDFDCLGSVTLPRSLSVSCFRFSDFYRVCKDLVQFSQAYFTEEENALIEDKTDAILDRLCGMFLDMYEESLTLHATEEIQSEMEFIDLLYSPEKDIKVKKGKTDLNEDMNFAREAKINTFKKYDDNPLKIKGSTNPSSSLPDWLMSDYWLYEGIRCNDIFLHSDAINYLTAAIQKDPYNIEAYQERIHAHFEMGNLGLAIEDYNKLKQLGVEKKTFYVDQFGYVVNGGGDQGDYVVNSRPKGMVDYSVGFYVGVAKGGGVAVVEFIPSILSSCKGILHGLWSLACSPVEVSKDLIYTSYELVEFIKENTPRECLELVVPELRELCINWDSLSDYDRGNETGYIIGKYGVDILAPGTALKGVKKYRQLKRLNSMFTVECCVASEAKKVKIIEASSKHAAVRTTVFESIKAGKIVPRNSNVIPHVMQEKHAWNRLLKLSDDKAVDFKKVAVLLEKNKILQQGKKTFLGSFLKENKKVHRYQYIIEIEGNTVEAHFVEYVVEKQSFLSNAWIITRF